MNPAPFKIDVPQLTLEKIMAKVSAFEWPDAPVTDTGDPWAYGASIGYMKQLVEYWRTTFDWRKAERALNQFPHYLVRVEDLDIHYIFEKGSNAAPRPLLLLHGWPGSIFEFSQVIEPLAHPERFGGTAADGFDVIVPSLPGYGFSAKPPRPIGPRTVARYVDGLMTGVLGLSDYIAQGGDWGSTIASWLAFEYPGCRAAHLNRFGWRSPGVRSETPDELSHAAQAARIVDKEGAYFHQHVTKPLTLSYALADSPVGVCAWIIEKFKSWSQLSGGDIESVYTKDQLLTSVMIYLVTGTISTSIWLYRGFVEDAGPPIAAGARIEKPVAVANFPGDLVGWPPRSFVERHMNVQRWTDMGEGGHFAALEKPQKFIADVQAFARELADQR